MVKAKVSAKAKVTKDMLLGEVISKYPSTMEVFLSHGLHCAGCGAAFSETVEMGAESHGIDLKAILKDLNKAASKKK
jgi:hybrid cluster-associated redox disulfide protein